MNSADRRHFLDVANHHFHDATLDEIRVLPGRSQRGTGSIEVLLSYPHVELTFRVTFRGCVNVSLGLDFDVLADSLPHHTAGFSESSDPVPIEELIRSLVETWNVGYADVRPGKVQGWASGPSPLAGKLAKAGSLTRYEIQYFGGTLLVVSSSAQIQRVIRPRRKRKR